MGNSLQTKGSRKEVLQARKLDREISSSNWKDFKTERSTLSLLLLGMKDSGKSTILLQARKLYGKRFEDSDFVAYREKIHQTIISQFKALVKYKNNLGGDYTLTSPENEDAAQMVLGLSRSTEVTEDIGASLKKLWKDVNFQKVWAKRSEIDLSDCLKYFMQDSVLDRIMLGFGGGKKKYTPIFEDVLQCAHPTTGVRKEEFVMGKTPFQIYDLGGQKSERKAWINCFDNVTSVIYVVSMNDFNNGSGEEDSRKAFDETLRVWEDVVNRKEFEKTQFMVFFNKYDLFEEKLRKVPFKVLGERNDFYNGPEPSDCRDGSEEQKAATQDCAEYMRQSFEDGVDSNEKKKNISYHYTIATDSSYMRLIFDTCRENILREVIEENGFVTDLI